MFLPMMMIMDFDPTTGLQVAGTHTGKPYSVPEKNMPPVSQLLCINLSCRLDRPILAKSKNVISEFYWILTLIVCNHAGWGDGNQNESARAICQSQGGSWTHQGDDGAIFCNKWYWSNQSCILRPSCMSTISECANSSQCHVCFKICSSLPHMHLEDASQPLLECRSLLPSCDCAY